MELIPARDQLNIREIAADIFQFASRLSFGVTIVLIPLRYRWLLHAHPVPPVFVEYTNQYLYPADIFLLSTLLFWSFNLVGRSRRISLQPFWLTFPLGGLVAVSFASSFFSIDPPLSFYSSTRMAALFGLYIYVINEVNSLGIVSVSAGLQLFIQSTIGIAQVLRQHSLGLVALKELSLDPAVRGISIVWTDSLRSLRAYGLTDHPNILGGCLAFSLLLLLVMYLKSPPHWQPLIGILFCLGVLALFLTFSRAAWLGLFAGLVWILLWMAIQRNWRGIRMVTTISGLIALVLLPFLWGYAPFLSSRLNLDGSFWKATPENQSVNERKLLLSQANQIIENNPLTGVGVGTFPEALHQQDPNYPFDYQPPHLVPVQVAAETGFFGAGLYIMVLVTPWILLFLNRRKLGSSLYLAGACSALLAIGVISFLDYYPWLLNPGRIWQWLIWGLWASFYYSSLKGKVDD